MKIHRIYAILLRNLYLFRRSYDRLADSFYWITLDLLTWGITGVYFQSFSPESQNIVFMLISGVVLWNLVYRTQSDINVSLLEELWNKNLINLFVSPLKFSEFISGLVILGVVKAMISLMFGTLLAWLFFHISIFSYSIHLVFFFLSLVLTGIWVGFMISSIILRFGTRIQTLAWTFVWIISPFSAIYYPLETLPNWAQYISRALPTSYVFEQGRNLLLHDQINYQMLAVSFVLNAIYIVGAFQFLKSSFRKVLQKGLVKVY